MEILSNSNPEFWAVLDTLIQQSEIIIDRFKDSSHPRFPDFIYPLDYGYLKGTASMDNDGIDLWLGSDPAGQLDAIMVIADAIKKDSEIKLLIGCTEEEKALIYQTHNQTKSMKGILIHREKSS